METRLLKYDEIISEKLQVLHVDEEKVIGEVVGADELRELRDQLHHYNFWFSTRNVEKVKPPGRLHWVLPKLSTAPPQGVTLSDHAPFLITRVVNKDCRRGRAYWKKKSCDGDEVKRREWKRKPYRTSKADCPAKMTVRTVLAYPEYAISSDTSRKNKNKTAQVLKAAIVRGKVVGEERYVVSISRAAHHHSHQQNEGSHDATVPLHPLVARYVTALVARGNVASPRAIKTLVTQFSREHFNVDETLPDNRCFFPMVKDIRELLQGLVREVEASEIHQAGLTKNVGVLVPIDEHKSQIYPPLDHEKDQIFTSIDESGNKLANLGPDIGVFLTMSQQKSQIFSTIDEADNKMSSLGQSVGILVPVNQEKDHICIVNNEADNSACSPDDEQFTRLLTVNDQSTSKLFPPLDDSEEGPLLEPDPVRNIFTTESQPSCEILIPDNDIISKMLCLPSSEKRIFTIENQTSCEIPTSNNKIVGKVLSHASSEKKIFASENQPSCKILTPDDKIISKMLFPRNSELLASVTEPESKIIHRDECEGIVDNGTESLAIEKQIIVVSEEECLTPQFNHDQSQDENITMHVVSSSNSPGKLHSFSNGLPCDLDAFSDAQTVPNVNDVSGISSEKLDFLLPLISEVSEDSDINSDKVNLLSALEQTFRHVATVDDPIAIKEALRYVQQAALVLETSVNK